MNKRKRQINWEKGLTKLFSLIFIILLFIYSIGMVTDSVSASKDQEVIEVVVKKGENLWTIANKYNNNQIDIRKLIFQIKEYNKIGDIIYPGQVIYIPLP